MSESCPYCKGTGLVQATVATRLVRLREERGLTQDQVADGIHVSRTQVANLERGRGSPSVETLVSMAEYFGVTTDHLLGRTV